MKKIILIVTVFSGVFIDAGQSATLSNVIEQYQTAFQDLITAHQQMYPNSVINLSDNSLLATTYAKLINPCSLHINGYAQLVSSEVARNFPFHADLEKLLAEFNIQEAEVKKIAAMLPESVRTQAMDGFYSSVAPYVVSVGFDIVKNLAHQYQYDHETMNSAVRAYQLAWRAQTSTMTILGCASVVDFQSQLTANMQTLFSGAIQHYQSVLSQGMVESAALLEIYKKLELYSKVLYFVDTNSGDSNDAANQQALLESIQSQQASYEQALSDEQQGDAQAGANRAAIVLDVNNAATVTSAISASLSNLGAAATLYENAVTSYQAASDLVGGTRAGLKQDLVDEYDLLMRFMQQLWALYLVDQSGQGVYTLPTLASFASGQAAGQTANVVEALNNLCAMISSQYATDNNVIALANASAQQNLLMTSIVSDVMTFAQAVCTNQKIVKIDPLFDVQLVSHVSDGLQMVDSWGNAVVQALNSDQAALAQAMAYGKHLDDYFAKHKNVTQYVPHLPDCLATNKTWVNFTAQILLQAGVVTSAQQAMGLVGTVTVTVPVSLSAQDLVALSNKATAFLSQAATAEKSSNFLQASSLYQKAMNDYKILYANEPDEATAISMAQSANIAQSRFAATSFASIVQSSGSATFATLTDVPTAFTARSYSLSVDTTIMNNSMPSFLSSLTVGQAMTTLSATQKQDLLQLIKAYLVAAHISDHGGSFSNYFSDYRLTAASPSDDMSSVVAQISNYLNDSQNIRVVSVTMQSATSVTILLSNFPLAPVTAVTSELSSAAEFYASAALLVGSGTDYINIGGQSYYPGNDTFLAQTMNEKAAYAYLAQALIFKKQAEAMIAQATTSLGAGTALPAGFSDTLDAILNRCLSAQAQLSATLSQTAYSYFTAAGLTAQATAVQQEFINIYEMQIEFCKKCLIGDPTSNDYQNVVRQMNKLYVAWGAQLTDQTQITALNTKIAELYVLAGNAAVKFYYTQSEYPNFKQIHYIVASQYFNAALEQYQFLQNSVQITATTAALDKIYYQASAQNLNLYFYVKQSGAMYTPTISSQAILVSYAQMQKDFAGIAQGVSMDGNETRLYTTVQDLLINAAIIYQHLLSQFPTGTPAQKQAARTKVLAFLQKQNVINTASVTDFTQIPYDEASKVLGVAKQLYNQFKNHPMQLAEVVELMFTMVKNQYLVDYHGVTASATQADLTLYTQDFLTKIQQKLQGLTNPTYGYIR